MQLVHITLVACKDQTPGLQIECQHATHIKNNNKVHRLKDLRICLEACIKQPL